MIEYTKNPDSMTSRYDARVGHLHVGAQDNGEGHWNWWVALVEQPFCAGDTCTIETGGAKTLRDAKAEILDACQKIAADIVRDVDGAQPSQFWRDVRRLAAMRKERT